MDIFIGVLKKKKSNNNNNNDNDDRCSLYRMYEPVNY